MALCFKDWQIEIASLKRLPLVSAFSNKFPNDWRWCWVYGLRGHHSTGQLGGHGKVQPCSLCCTHTQPQRRGGTHRVARWAKGRDSSQECEHTAESAYSPRSCGRRGRPLGRGQWRPPRAAAAAAAASRGPASCRLAGTCLQLWGCSSCLAAPETSALWTWVSSLQTKGAIFSSTCSCLVFFCIYANLKPVPPLPSHSSDDAGAWAISAHISASGLDLTPSLKPRRSSCVKSGFAPTWGCMCACLEVPPPRNYAKAIRKSWEQNQVI